MIEKLADTKLLSNGNLAHDHGFSVRDSVGFTSIPLSIYADVLKTLQR